VKPFRVNFITPLLSTRMLTNAYFAHRIRELEETLSVQTST
jgi:hypothetical protein